jgi:hypothetical protein
MMNPPRVATNIPITAIMMRALLRTILRYFLVGEELIEYINNHTKRAMSITCMKNPTRENTPRYHSNIIAISAKKPRMT